MSTSKWVLYGDGFPVERKLETALYKLDQRRQNILEVLDMLYREEQKFDLPWFFQHSGEGEEVEIWKERVMDLLDVLRKAREMLCSIPV